MTAEQNSRAGKNDFKKMSPFPTGEGKKLLSYYQKETPGIENNNVCKKSNLPPGAEGINYPSNIIAF